MPPERIAEILAACYKAEVEDAGINCSFDDETVKHIVSLAEFLANPGPKFGVLLVGSVGNGKTTLMKALKRAVSFIGRQFFARYMAEHFDPRLYFHHAIEIADFAKENQREFRDTAAAWLLAIDDLGTEPKEVLAFGNVYYPMIRLLENRYRHRLFTVATTNLSGTEIAEKYEARIWDRFLEMFHIITFGNPSYRPDIV